MGNEKTTQSKKTTRKITVEDSADSKKVKQAPKSAASTKTTSAVAKVKRRLPARIIKDAEIVAEPKTQKTTSPKESQKAKVSTPASTKVPQKRIIHRIEVTSAPPITKEEPKPTTSTLNQTKSTKKNVKLPLIRRIHIKARYIVAAAIVLIFAIFFGRVAIWEHNYLLAKEGSERDVVSSSTGGVGGSAGVTGSAEGVDETKPTETEVKEYIVAPDKPRYFTINSLGIYKALVYEVGLNASGELGTPSSAYAIGWYNGSVLPGQDGVSMLDAHGGDMGNGVFRNLPKIAIGAEITIEMGDGRQFTYVVADKTTKPIGDEANGYMTTAFTSPVPGTPSMTLITCTGEWSQVQQTYLERFFVRATLK